MTHAQAQWVRVTKATPCPVCNHDGYCSIDATDGTVLCMRTKSDRPAPSGGWLHRDVVDQPPPPPPKREKPAHDWARIAEAYQSNVHDDELQQFARSLGVDPIALRELGIGKNGSNWTFPMYGADGSVCGIRRRTPSGGKLAMPGSSLGLIRRQHRDEGPQLVLEGESDTAAMLTLGFDAVGLPGCGTCHDTVAAHVIDRDVIVMLDGDKAGREATDRLVPKLLHTAKSVRVVLPPDGIKDARAWRQAGATRADVEAAIAAAPLEQEATAEPTAEAAPTPAPSPIETGWGHLSPTMFSTTPPPRRWLLRHPTKDGAPCDPGEGDGLLPRGKAGLLTAEGGAGKTMAVLALAVCVATGHPWLGYYPVSGEGGNVLLLLGEEDAEEVHRRLWAVGRALGLTSAEKDTAAARIVALPLAGEECALAVQVKPNVIVPSPHYQALRRMLEATAPPSGWALVVVDPLSRFAGVPIDVDNFGATRVVQVVESLVRAPGNPTVLALHHSSKDARKNGTVDARGATGITDGVRWVAGLTCRDDGNVEFRQTKSNYSRPMPEAMGLARGPDGVLYATGSTAGAASRARDERELADRAAILASLRDVGQSTSIDAIVAGARLKAQRGRALVRRMIDEGDIAVRGTSKRPIYSVAGEEPAADREGGEDTPYPRDGGTPSVAGGSDDVPRFRDANGTPGTPTQDEGQPEQPKGRFRKRTAPVPTAKTAGTEVA